jgi:hypothetical protein
MVDGWWLVVDGGADAWMRGSGLWSPSSYLLPAVRCLPSAVRRPLSAAQQNPKVRGGILSVID